MFNIDLRPVFKAKVTAYPPGDGDEQTFWATFEALPIDEFTAFDIATGEGCRAFLERAWIGVTDIVDGEGNAVPDSAQLRRQIANRHWARGPLVSAYLQGLAEGQAGN